MSKHPQRRNRINQQFSVRLIEMLESPAYRVLSISAHRVIDRIDIELAAHGGNDNGRLPVTYQDFIDYGIVRDCIAPALREAEALGFSYCTKRGSGGNAEHREASLYGLTFAHARDSKQSPPTHKWKHIKTIEEANAIAAAARANKSPAAIAKGRWANRKKTESQSGNPHRSRSGNPHRKQKVFSPETRTTGPVRKPTLLSISGVRGEHPSPASSSADPPQPTKEPPQC